MLIKCAIVSLHTPNIAEYAELTAANKRQYCDRWGCEFIGYSQQFDTRPPAWSKIVALIKHLPYYDWLLWMDADACILQPDVDLFAPIVNSDKHFLFSYDHAGINCGIFAVRNTPDALAYLHKINGMSDRYENHCWWEQAAIHELHRTDAAFRELSGMLEKRVYNGYPNEENIVVLHTPSWKHADRVAIFSKFCTTMD